MTFVSTNIVINFFIKIHSTPRWVKFSILHTDQILGFWYYFFYSLKLFLHPSIVTFGITIGFWSQCTDFVNKFCFRRPFFEFTNYNRNIPTKQRWSLSNLIKSFKSFTSWCLSKSLRKSFDLIFRMEESQCRKWVYRLCCQRKVERYHIGFHTYEILRVQRLLKLDK